VERSPSDLHYRSRKLIVHGFPIGIELDEFKSRLKSKAVQSETAVVEREFESK
jgi:trehalose-6-phosphate synthase